MQTDTDLGELLLRVARRIRRGHVARLAPLGLTPGQARALRVITRLGPLRMAELAGALDIVPRSATTVVDALEASGLVRREPDPANRRATLVALTDRGAAVRDEMREARREATEEVLGVLTAGQRERLGALLAELGEQGSDAG